MKQFQDETNIFPGEEETAGLILETVPLIMKVIRADRRQFGDGVLPLAHFRILANLSHHPEASLSDLAEEIGLALPSISKIVDTLFENGLVSRREAENDRRYLRLSLTDEGAKTLQAARLETQHRLAMMLQETAPEERASIVHALHSLRDIFMQRKNSALGRNAK
jgi:DNA-binding MarR family transcriptional regulator